LAPRALEAMRVSREGKGPWLRRGPSDASRLYYQSEEFGAPFTLFVLIRCLSLWIGLLDEGFDLRPVAVDVRFCRASGVGGSCHGSRRVLMNMSVYSRAGFVPARDGSCDQAS